MCSEKQNFHEKNSRYMLGNLQPDNKGDVAVEQHSLASFCIASTMPWKMIVNKDVVADGRIVPLHVIMIPTDKCNAACSFCPIRNMPRKNELTTSEWIAALRHFHSLGTRAVTLVGGGEPTLHPGIEAFLDVCRELDIQVGIITNGLLWSAKQGTVFANGKLIWARMSIIDTESGGYDVDRLCRFAENLPNVDIGVSFTVTARANLDTGAALAEMAETIPNVTHIKFIEDYRGGAAETLSNFEKAIKPGKTKAIFQFVEAGCPGSSVCRVSLLRPMIAADGCVHACCSIEGVGTEPGNPGPFSKKVRRMHWSEFTADTPPFDGTHCKRCLWSRYNEALEELTKIFLHPRFV